MSTRPLPSRPNLEYEHKAAKKLLAGLRRSDADALARIRAQLGGDAATSPDALKLSDAQLAIAREYGFSSWPRLVDYFKTLERHERGPREFLDSSDTYERRAQQTLERHARRHALTAQQFASFVPRFYGVSTADVLDATVTLDEARLVVARTNRCPSWESLIEQSNARPGRPDPWIYFDTPRSRQYDGREGRVSAGARRGSQLAAAEWDSRARAHDLPLLERSCGRPDSAKGHAEKGLLDRRRAR
jgi:hypothetical protein